MKAIPNVEESAIAAGVFSVCRARLICCLIARRQRRFQYIDLELGFPRNAFVVCLEVEFMMVFSQPNTVRCE